MQNTRSINLQFENSSSYFIKFYTIEITIPTVGATTRCCDSDDMVTLKLTTPSSHARVLLSVRWYTKSMDVLETRMSYTESAKVIYDLILALMEILLERDTRKEG